MVEATQQQTGAESIVWDLSHLYSGNDDPNLTSDMQVVLEMADEFVKNYRGKVATLDAEELRAAIDDMIAIQDKSGRISAYASLTFSTDTADPQNGALIQRIQEHGAQLNQRMVFFNLEWNQADEDHVQAMLATPVLEPYHHHLEAWRRYQPYQLDEAGERLMIEMGVNGRSAWTRFFTQLTSAMRYDFDGEQLTQTQVLSKMHETDREVRRKAADAMTAGLRNRSMELTYIFNVLANDKATTDRIRNYPDWITSRNLSNKAPDSVVNALIEAVTSRYDIVARHYNLKRILLGLDELTDYDRYAPLKLDADESFYTWDEAHDTVVTAFKAFHPSMADTAEQFFNNNWIHAALLPDKQGGAYAHPTVPSANPFVFMNYTGKPRDVATLAHELGHGIHMALSAEKSGLLGLYTPLTTAEMASVFGEMLVFSDLMQKEDDPAARLGMLLEKIEDSFATVFRQTAMNRFEEALHTARRTQGELNTEQISDIWLKTQNDMFQGSVNLRDDYGLWWSYIPHFLHTPGYVYAYSFGELLVLALYNVYQEEGEGFADKYVDVLADGNSDYPDKLLAKVGVDLNDPNFWHKGLDALEKLVEQEEQAAREVYPEKFA